MSAAAQHRVPWFTPGDVDGFFGLFFSGFLFEVASMPAPLRAFSRIVPAYYYVPGLQTLFLAGDIWAVILPESLVLIFMATALFTLTARKTRQRLD